MNRALLAAVLLGAVPAGAVEWTPLGQLDALGGMHSFNGDRGSFSGNLDGTFAPALRFSDSWAVLPSVRAEYDGTRRLTDVLGTGTPAEQRAEGRVGVLGVWGSSASRWRLKPSVSYDAEALKETRDEAWGRGLFDQQRLTVGAEAEYLTDEPHSLRLGADWFRVTYPNYSTLESQAAFLYQGRSLSRELVGEHALDRTGYQFSAAGDAALGSRLEAEGRAAAVWSSFPQQRLVDEGGQFKLDTRQDIFLDAAFSIRMPHEWNADRRALGAFELGVTANKSNQNGYDATRGRFMAGFYDFVEWRASPSLTVILGPVRRPVRATFKLGWKRRGYPHRRAQDATGAYRADALSTEELSGGLSVTYPMARRLSLLFEAERASARSNQDFQPFYRYSYQATTAMAGVRWDW